MTDRIVHTPVTPEFTTLETFTITGRGMVHVVAVSDEDLANRDPRTLVEKFVRLDGELRKVRGVETPCNPLHPVAPGVGGVPELGVVPRPARLGVVVLPVLK